MSWAVLSHRILRLLWCIVALGAATAAEHAALYRQAVALIATMLFSTSPFATP